MHLSGNGLPKESGIKQGGRILVLKVADLVGKRWYEKFAKKVEIRFHLEGLGQSADKIYRDGS